MVILIIGSYNLGSSNHRELPTTLSTLNATIHESNERPSPKERINISDIHISNNRVVIDVKNPKWAIFTDTNSMDPVLDVEAKAIEVDANCDDIQVGDIVSYKSKEGVIIHRVIEIGYDDKGKYFIFKGDNNKLRDPYKVRCSDLQRVVVAIIY